MPKHTLIACFSLSCNLLLALRMSNKAVLKVCAVKFETVAIS